MIKNKANRIDEMQYKKRNEIACISYCILFLAVLANSFLKLFIGDWAEPIAEGYIVLFIQFAYFVFFSVLNNVYFGNYQNRKTIILLDCLATVLLLLDITVFKFNGNVFGFHNGRLINNFWKVPMLIIFILLLLSCLIRSYIEKKYTYYDNCDSKDTFDLVLLKTANNDYELSMLKEILKDNNIPYIVNDKEGGGYLRIHSGISMYSTNVLVEKAFYEKAKKLINETFGDDE